MWEFVQTVPDGSALGDKIKDALEGVGLPALRGMGPGMLEDVKSALNPGPVINAVVGSGYPQCKLVKKQVGDVDGNIQNVDGVLLVDPVGIMSSNGSAPFYQERWVQDTTNPKIRMKNGKALESAASAANRADPIQLSYESWSAEPKIYKENGCRVDPNGTEKQPSFCNAKLKSQIVTLGDGSTVTTYIEGFTNYKPAPFKQGNPQALVSLSVAVISVLCLISFWGSQRR
jgi:hypothetical protein